MNRRETIWQVAVGGWLRFWYEQPSLTTLAVLRIGTGMVLFYSLFIFSFDLTTHLAQGSWGDLSVLRQSDPVAWPFSIFDWVDAHWWLWTVHFTAMLLAAAFTLGVVPSLTGLLSVLFYLSYGHRNPAVMVDLDGLLVMSVIYLSAAPTGRVLSLLPALFPPPRRFPTQTNEPDPNRSPWGGFMLRVIQIQVCLLYFLSGLSSMVPLWLSGEALLHPSLAERGLPLGLATFTAHSAWPVGIAHGLTVLSLFYGVLVWLPRFRYPVIVLTIAVHAVVGIVWGVQAYNVLMIVLNLAFVDSDLIEALRVRIAPLLAMPWLPPGAR